LNLSDKTLSLEAKINFENAIKYWRASYAKINYATLRWVTGEPIRAEVYVLSRKPVYVDSSSTTHAADPGVEPLTWASGGENPFTIDGEAVKVQAFNVTIRNNLRPVYAGGLRDFAALMPGERRINGTITILWEDTSYWDILTSDQYKDIVWILKSGSPSYTLTIANAKLSRVNRFPWTPGGDAIAESYDFFAKTCSLTET